MSSEGFVTVAQTTTVHCPDCGARVAASHNATAVACPKCSTAFSPWGLPTTARPAPATQVGPASPPNAASVAPTPVAHGAVPEDDLTGKTFGGRKIVRLIGRGGMGAVYEAEDARHGRVAVKVLPPELARDPDFVSRFRREATVLSGLSHPHLVEVYERGQDGERCYFVMEFVRGESLRRVMDRGPLPWRDAVRVTRDVLAGLGYAHGRGVVHRDLKPENVLLDTDSRARLVDFGLSRIVRGEAAEELSRLTRTNVILGTYEYMAPEQRLGSPVVDERADLYTLGVILYEMLTGSLPLGRFEAASVVRPGIPSSLDGVIHRALASSGADRFPSAVAFRESLDIAEASAGPATKPTHRPASPAPGNAITPSVAAMQVPADFGPDRLEAARKVLRHVEFIAGADRALGFFAFLFFLGFSSIGGSVHASGAWRLFLPVFGVGSGILLIASFLLLKQGKRLYRMEPGSREAQVTASLFLLVMMPPIGTALGIYGLIKLTTDAARDAFALGRARLQGTWTPSPVAPSRPLPARGTRHGPAAAGWWRFVLCFGAVFMVMRSGLEFGDPGLGFGHQPFESMLIALPVAAAFAWHWGRLGFWKTLVVGVLAWLVASAFWGGTRGPDFFGTRHGSVVPAVERWRFHR